MKQIINAIKENRLIVIFGCSQIGKEIAEYIKEILYYDNFVFADNSEQKQNEGFLGKKVVSPIYSINQNPIYIIASINFYSEMIKQLVELGVNNENIVLSNETLIKKISDLEKLINKRIPKKKMNFVIDLSEHCNLNCQNCDHFSPLAEKKFMDIDVFKNDIARMAELFGGQGEYITSVDLEGGEPLLNEKVTDYIVVVHKYMPDTVVRIFTNGILLKNMDDLFWKICREHRVVLEITKYPIEFDYNYIVEKAKKEKVELKFFSGGDVIKTSSHKPINLDGTSDIYDSFHKCYMANGDCPMLKEGKLYPCTFVPNISIFNKYFEKNIEVCDRDYIDIYKDTSMQEIFEFLSNPIPACKYCQPEKWTNGHVWKTSKKEICEWT